MNDRDSEALAGLFLERGYILVENPQEADVILVNTCSVRAHAENRALSLLGTFKKFNHKKIIGLIGCMAKNLGKEVFKKMPHVDLICSPTNFDRIPDYVEKIKKQGMRILDLEERERNDGFFKAKFREKKKSAQVVISFGCSNNCSYCVVPFVRDPLRLREPKKIIEEVKRNVEMGIKKITLLGQNVNDYSYKEGEKIINFVDLLKMVEKVEGVEEIDFITNHPKNTSQELFYFMAESKKVKKHLHLPFQAGSNRILKLMKRGYTKEEYLKLVEDYKKIVKGTLSTDVIVGFPTESEEDFNQTKEVLEKVKFKYAYIFKYSVRPHTEAEKLKDNVPKEIKEKRHQILLSLQKRISLNLK
jgi:tRNA-2-methylthio-N6-dimethylallyladenosine synthase